jgi:hypothetical protein
MPRQIKNASMDPKNSELRGGESLDPDDHKGDLGELAAMGVRRVDEHEEIEDARRQSVNHAVEADEEELAEADIIDLDALDEEGEGPDA